MSRISHLRTIFLCFSHGFCELNQKICKHKNILKIFGNKLQIPYICNIEKPIVKATDTIINSSFFPKAHRD